MAAPSREHVFSSGALTTVKERKIIKLKDTGKTCRLCSSAPEDIIL